MHRFSPSRPISAHNRARSQNALALALRMICRRPTHKCRIHTKWPIPATIETLASSFLFRLSMQIHLSLSQNFYSIEADTVCAASAADPLLMSRCTFATQVTMPDTAGRRFLRFFRSIIYVPRARSAARIITRPPYISTSSASLYYSKYTAYTRFTD
jgi:hypothetical protein